MLLPSTILQLGFVAKSCKVCTCFRKVSRPGIYGRIRALFLRSTLRALVSHVSFPTSPPTSISPLWVFSQEIASPPTRRPHPARIATLPGFLFSSNLPNLPTLFLKYYSSSSSRPQSSHPSSRPAAPPSAPPSRPAASPSCPSADSSPSSSACSVI